MRAKLTAVAVAVAVATAAAFVLAACSSGGADGGGGQAAPGDLTGEGAGDSCAIDGAPSRDAPVRLLRRLVTGGARGATVAPGNGAARSGRAPEPAGRN